MGIAGKANGLCVVLGFRLEAYEICALLGVYCVQNGSFLQTFRDLYRNVGKKLPFYANTQKSADLFHGLISAAGRNE
jgi:hypothetical protein